MSRLLKSFLISLLGVAVLWGLLVSFGPIGLLILMAFLVLWWMTYEVLDAY